MIKVTHQIRKHQGGTKFYETVLFENGAGRSVLIKRYGSMDKIRGRGQYKIEDYSTSAEAAVACSDIWKAKNKPKEYNTPVSVDHGFGLFVGGTSDYDNYESLHADTAGHYSDESTAETILTILGVDAQYDPNKASKPATPTPAWVPHESDDFGSW